MQIVEGSDWALRTARLSLTSPRSEVQVTLFPMVHVGEPAFFQAVYDDAFSHDVVLVEGVRSPITRRVTRCYRWIEGSKELNLGVQPPYPTQAACRARIIHADLSADEFVEVWRKVPRWARAFIYVVAPAVGIWLRWFGSRHMLAKRLSLDDLPRRGEILNLSPETAALDRAILHARDTRLIARIGAQERTDHGLLADIKKIAVSILADPPDVATFVAHVMLGQPLPSSAAEVPVTGGSVVRLNPLIQPWRDAAANRWVHPPGLPIPQFKALRELSTDAVEDDQIARIDQLCDAWLADQVYNQPIRANSGTLDCEIGHRLFLAGKAEWLRRCPPVPTG